MKITFIYPPFTHKKFNENVSAVDNEFGVYPPLGLAYAAAILRKNGADVDIIDANALRISKEGVLQKLRKAKPDVIGFDLHSAYVFFDTLKWVNYFKANLPHLKIIVGGFNFNLYPREIMAHNSIDYGLMGSANAAPKLLLDFLQTGQEPSRIPGLVYRNSDRLIINRSEKKYCSPEELPFPARDLLPVDKYYSFISKRKNYTVMLSQIGCPFRCIYCAIAPLPHLKRSAKNIFSEILECYNKYNIREIDFFDGTFTVDKKIVYELCSRIIKSGLNLYWSCRTRVDCVDEELLKIMAASGCKKIYYGIESVDSEVLSRVKKDITISRVHEAIRITKKLKIEPLCFFMIGNPGDTIKKFKASIEFAKTLDADYIQISRTIAKPKTGLDRKLQEITGRDYWSDYLRGLAKEERLLNPWCEISEEEIEKTTKSFYISFYFRPAYLIKRIISIRSTHELKRYIKTGAKMIISRFIKEDI